MPKNDDKMSPKQTAKQEKEKQNVAAVKKDQAARFEELEKTVEEINKVSDPTSVVAVGRRIREARMLKGYSQAYVANMLGERARTGVAQWELGHNSPSLQIINQLADLLETDRVYLTHGVKRGPPLINPHMEDIGCYLCREVVFDSGPTDTRVTADWALPTRWLRQDLNIGDVTKVILYRIEAAFQASRYENGDTLIIDQGSTRPSPGGTFLYWDGVGPAIADITVVPVKNKAVAKVRNMDGNDFEAGVDDLVIIGRVRGMWRKS